MKTLKNCESCLLEFGLYSRCKHFGKKIRRRRMKDDENVLIGSSYSSSSNNSQSQYVKCGFCSDFYLKRSSSHSCYLKKSDSIFGNARRHSSTIKSYHVFYYDIESRLENNCECKIERPDQFDDNGRLIRERKQLRKAFFASDENGVNEYKSKLNDEEKTLLVVSKCQNHQPTLLCVVNESNTVKRDFCEKDLNGGDPILSFFKWVVNDVVKPTNSSRNEKNDYSLLVMVLLMTLNSCIKLAHNFFGYKNVNVLLHMNRMIELRIQIHTGFRMCSIFFKDSFKFMNLPLGLLPKSFGFHNELQKGIHSPFIKY